jgi:hypothetical protein
VTEPIRPVGHRPAVLPPVAAGQSPVAHRRRREEDTPEERERREPRDDGGYGEPGDDTPDADGHIDVLA